jgi:hypothetical protein
MHPLMLNKLSKFIFYLNQNNFFHRILFEEHLLIIPSKNTTIKEV